MATSAHEVQGNFRTRPDVSRADAHFVGGLFSRDRSAPPGVVRFEAGHGINFGVYQLRPESKGSIRIASADPARQPKIITNFLATDNDRRAAVDMVRYMRRLFDQPVLARYLAEETTPGRLVESDEAIIDATLNTGNPVYHATGTCRMGADCRSVVDNDLKVRGVAGLRVMDCSVMPTMVSAGTNASVMAMAWRAADIIRSAPLA